MLPKKRRKNEGIIVDERKPKAKNIRKNEVIIVDERKEKAKHQRKQRNHC